MPHLKVRFDRPRGRLAAAAAVLALGAVAVAWLILNGEVTSAAQPPAESAVPAHVGVTTASQADLSEVFSGRFEAAEAVEVRARVSGAIRSTHFQEGGLVRRGDLLVQIDPEPYQAEVDRLISQVEAAQARTRFTGLERDRANQLVTSGSMAARERDRRVSEAAEAEAGLGMARAQLRVARLNLSYTQVRAPISGRAGRRELTAGNLVDAGPNAPVLTTVLSVDPIHAAFDADEAAVARALAELGGDRSRLSAIPVRAEVEGGETSGRLLLIDNRVDASAGTIQLKAAFDNPSGALTPGQFTRLHLGRANPEPVILVPEQAIGTDQSRRYVLVLASGDRAAYREVQLGQAQGALRVVTSGLVAGERIVLSNLQRVRPGVRVQPRSVATPAAK